MEKASEEGQKLDGDDCLWLYHICWLSLATDQSPVDFSFPHTSLWTALGPAIDVIIIHFGYTVELLCQNLFIFFQ